MTSSLKYFFRTCVAATLAVTAYSQAPADPPPVVSAPLADPTGPPKIWVSTSDWNIGEIWFGDPAATDIEIRNIGGGVLTIKNVGTSCGCTVAQPSKRQLGSNESDKIHMTYNTKKGIKNVTQQVTIETDDPKNPSVKVAVHGTVRNFFEVVNSASTAVVFGQMTTDTKDTVTLELKNNLNEKMHPQLKPIPDRMPYTVELETVEEGMSFKLKVTPKSSLSLGPAIGEVTITTGVEKWPEQRFGISGNVTQRVSIVPPVITVMKTQHHAPKRIANISYVKDHPIKIRDIRTSSPLVKAEVSTRGPSLQAGKRFESISLELDVPPWDEIPEDGLTVMLDTDDDSPEFKTITLKIVRQPDHAGPGANPGSPRAVPADKPMPPKPVGESPQPQPQPTTKPTMSGVKP